MTGSFINVIQQALGKAPVADIEVTGSGSLPSVYAVTDLAAASVGCAAAEIAALVAEVQGTDEPAKAQVDRKLASYWFKGTILPQGWELPPVWDNLAGDYQGADGWIKLHTNAPHHRAAAVRVLDCDDNKDVVADKIRNIPIDQLEADIVAAGGCAAAMRDTDRWHRHASGSAVNNEPLIHWQTVDGSGVSKLNGNNDQPLAGIRVLDLTRVLAGPVCTRFLAGWGADVLRLDPLDWEEGSVIPEVTLGKRCARIDLKSSTGREVFEKLLRDADVLVHGYRADALENLGFDETWRRQQNPGLIDVRLNAYGWTSPWANRRGFDSLVQMSCGIAQAGMLAAKTDKPFPLPAQALDHATGYLMAAATVRALRNHRTSGEAASIKCSLARTATLLMSGPAGSLQDQIEKPAEADWQADTELTSWGPASRLLPPCDVESQVESFKMKWQMAAGKLGRHEPGW